MDRCRSSHDAPTDQHHEQEQMVREKPAIRRRGSNAVSTLATQAITNNHKNQLAQFSTHHESFSFVAHPNKLSLLLHIGLAIKWTLGNTRNRAHTTHDIHSNHYFHPSQQRRAPKRDASLRRSACDAQFSSIACQCSAVVACNRQVRA